MNKQIAEFDEIHGPAGRSLTDYVEENIPALWDAVPETILNIQNTGVEYTGEIEDWGELASINYYPANKLLWFTPHVPNGANAKISISGLPRIPLILDDGSTVLPAGTLSAGVPYLTRVNLDGNALEMLSLGEPGPVGATGATGPQGPAGSVSNAATPPIEPADSDQVPNITYIRATTRPTLRGYFAVNPANEEQAVDRMQDAARSGMNVFVDPGNYGIDPLATLQFDGLPTIFQGAGAGLSRFHSLSIGPKTTTGSSKTLIQLLAGGSELHDVCIEGDDTFDTPLWPYIAALVRVGGSGSPGPVFGRQNHFKFSGLKGLGGAEMFAFGRADKVTVKNCYGYHQYDHVLAASSGQCDYIIDGLHGDHSGQEFIALSAPSTDTDGTAAQTNRVLITNFISDRCGANTRIGTQDPPFPAVPVTAWGPTEAIDLYIRSALNINVSNGIIVSGGGGGIEIKRDQTVLPQQYENLSLSNITFHSSFPASMVSMHWADVPFIAEFPEDTLKNITWTGLRARYAVGTPATHAAFVIKNQKNVEVQDCTVTGPAQYAFQYSTPEATATTATGRRLAINGFTAGDGVVGGILIASEHIEELHMTNVDLDVTGVPVQMTTELYCERMSLSGCHFRNVGGGGAGAVVLQNTVIRDFVIRNSRFESDVYGVHLNTMGTVTLAALPQINNCVSSGGLIKCTFAADHHLINDDGISISGILGTLEANGSWLVAVVDTTNVLLQDSVFVNAYNGASVTSVRRATKFIVDNCNFRHTSTGSSPACVRSDHDSITIMSQSCTARMPKAGRAYLDSGGDGLCYTKLFRGWLSAAPASGTGGAVGEWFGNQALVGGGTTGWVCTVAGASATWKALPNLAP